MREKNEDAYFAASNSEQGFYSYYQECFDHPRVDRVYAVKGGPGTGKSRFLREVAQVAAAEGRQVEYIYCSSDPDSLDGVILTGNVGCIALLDATAPHVYEPSHPGVREEIVNLGAFWDVEALTPHAEELEALGQKKRQGYRRAYRYLSAAGEMRGVRDGLVAPFLRRKAMEKSVQRALQGVPRGEGFSSCPALIHSVGMRGRVSLDTYFSHAKRIYLVEDCHGAAGHWMAELLRRCAEQQLAIRVSRHPVHPEVVDGIFLCRPQISFVVGRSRDCDYPHQRVSTRRFLEPLGMRQVRSQVTYAERLHRALLDGAVESLSEVKDLHFRMEEIYMSAMDFGAKEEFTKSFCRRLFGLQTK